MRVLRVVALLAVIAGAVGAVVFMLHVGHNQKSMLLLVLFFGWDVAPFAALAWAIVSPRWLPAGQVMVYITALVVSVVSLFVYYRVAYGPPMPQPASRFLLVPLLSWVLIAATVFLAARASGSVVPRSD
ncbi:MAG TPA: hypothetical protein VL549_07060 [Gemmatimonadales bacterium]|jgi:hypothetical protein|nr:hypothetical protein [Gemmatimonadales bacterium]